MNHHLTRNKQIGYLTKHGIIIKGNSRRAALDPWYTWKRSKRFNSPSWSGILMDKGNRMYGSLIWRPFYLNSAVDVALFLSSSLILSFRDVSERDFQAGRKIFLFRSWRKNAIPQINKRWRDHNLFFDVRTWLEFRGNYVLARDEIDWSSNNVTKRLLIFFRFSLFKKRQLKSILSLSRERLLDNFLQLQSSYALENPFWAPAGYT